MKFIMPCCNLTVLPVLPKMVMVLTKQNKMTFSSFLAYILSLKEKRCQYCSTNAYKKNVTTTIFMMIEENFMFLHTIIYLNENPWAVVEVHKTNCYAASPLVLSLSHRNEAWQCTI
jgi:hypothetical protein